MDETDLPVNLPIHTIAEFFTCSICMVQMSVTTMTSCGHRFCGKCIKEWVDRKHTCPCCNAHLNQNQLFKDHQYDSLIDTINTVKKREEEKYFEKLINAATSQETPDRVLSPVEKVLKDHLKQSLAAYGKYLQSLKDQMHQKMRILEAECSHAVSELQSHSLTQSELLQQTSDLNNTLSRQKEKLEQELQTCTQLIATAFDKHLSNHIPKLDVLPVKISVNLLDKNVRISEMVIAPADIAITKIKHAVEEAMKAKGNPVVEWADDVQFILFGPFVKCSPYEMQHIILETLTKGPTHQDVHILDHSSRPVLELAMKPNSEIVIYGSLRCESDLPKQCFIQTFKKGGDNKMDYFFCKQCSFKWICRSCMEICHKGHDVLPYIMNHVPEWACCYCPRKKKCVLQT